MKVLDILYPYQKEAVTSTFYDSKGIICLPTGTGKCLGKGTKILMYNGTTKNVEDIIVGDVIMGDDSKPRNILSIARGREMMYDIIPTKGDKYTVNESHILSLKITNIGKDRLSILDDKYKSGDIVDISVKDYLNVSKTAKHVLKGFRAPANFEYNENILPINPRLLGLWLADGNSGSPKLTVNKDDVEIQEYLTKECQAYNLNLNILKSKGHCEIYSFSTKLKGSAKKNSNPFLNALRDLNILNNKHIPHIYKTASKEDRLELLAGILDGDGHLDGCFDITLVNEGLIDDVIFIARSLGFACYKKKRIGRIKELNFENEYFRIHISGDVDKIPTILARKKASKRLQKKNVLSVGIKVIPTKVDDYYGFEIDGNRRFLLGDFTVTHNTFCEAAIVANDIVLNPGQFRIYVLNAPRIILTYQLLKEVYGFLVSNGIEARYSFVHSGGKTDESELEEMRMNANIDGHDIPFSEIGSGTSIESITDMMQKAKTQELPLIIFSTYNSADRIEKARELFTKQPISITLNDEAHYLVQEQFHDILHTLTSSRCYFFTATTIHTPSDKGRGMNNQDVYGEMLYKMIPREAIELGKMVRPRLHIVKTDGVYTNQDYEKSLSKLIYESYHQHSDVINDILAPKILISVKGTNDIKKFLKSKEYKLLKEEMVEIYAIASNDEIGNDANGIRVRRQDFLKILKEAGNDITRKMIVLHYDTLAEGIDVSGFTGIMPLRTLSKSKFLQTFGRSARLDKEDRKRLETGEILSSDIDKMNKPYAYIILPNVIHSNEDDRVNLTQIITELRDYGFNPSEDILSSSRINGISTIDELSGLNDIKTKIPNIGELIENLEADIESEINANLSKIEFLKKSL